MECNVMKTILYYVPTDINPKDVLEDEQDYYENEYEIESQLLAEIFFDI